jgi:hypothetical protein
MGILSHQGVLQGDMDISNVSWGGLMNGNSGSEVVHGDARPRKLEGIVAISGDADIASSLVRSFFMLTDRALLDAFEFLSWHVFLCRAELELMLKACS